MEDVVKNYHVEVESRRKLGLPPEILEKVDLKPGDLASIEVRADGRILIVPFAEVVQRFTGATPGLAEVMKLDEMRDGE